ncbi:MAG: DUF3137 domain-containing protein, partial [Verrucomicrobiota bacterium]
KNGRTTRFRGMFLVADVDVGIDDPVWLLPRDYVNMKEKLGRVSSLLSGFLDRMNQRKGDKVQIEDEEFNRLYSVVAENEQTATRLLTAELRHRLIALRQRAGEDVRISFQSNQIAVALWTDTDHFDPPLTKSLLSYDGARRFAADVSHALSIVIAIRPAT